MDAGKYARYEFERRFLVDHVPAEVDRGAGWRILDRYLEGTRLRLRRMEPAGGGPPVLKLGQKETPDPSDPRTAVITTIYLSAAEHAMLDGLPGHELAKTRHAVAEGDRRWAIDVFAGALDGLILAELEYPDAVAMARHTVLPAWIATEVTDDVSLAGAALAHLSPEEATALVARSLT